MGGKKQRNVDTTWPIKVAAIEQGVIIIDKVLLFQAANAGTVSALM